MNAAIETLPAIESARLPDTYQAAQRALSECSRIDECLEWANKAEALASYAKQAKDESLRKMADRIQARAIRRCGELLKQIPDDNRGRPRNSGDARPNLDGWIPGSGPTPSLDGWVPGVTRAEAAENAGMTEHRKKTAMRVASVPEEDFNAQVDSDSPPSINALAEQGKKAKPLVDLQGIPPSDYARATEAQGTLRRFADYCRTNDPARIAKAYKPHEIPALREYVSRVDRWLDVFVTNLPE